MRVGRTDSDAEPYPHYRAQPDGNADSPGCIANQPDRLTDAHPNCGPDPHDIFMSQ